MTMRARPDINQHMWMEAGEYPIYVGNSVRDAKEVGVYTEPELRVTEQCTEANAVEQSFERMVNNNGVIEYEAVPTATVIFMTGLKLNSQQRSRAMWRMRSLLMMYITEHIHWTSL